MLSMRQRITVENGGSVKIMKIEELESQLETLKTTVAELENKIAEIKRNEDKKIPDVKDIPQTYDFDDYERMSEYWYEVWILNCKCELVRTKMDEESIKKGNMIFPTVKFAEMFREKAQLIADCLLFKWLYDREFVPVWNGYDENFKVCFDTESKRYEAECNTRYENNNVYFSTKEIAEKCAEWLNYRRENEK